MRRPRPVEFLRGLQIVWLPRLPLSLRRKLARQIVRLILALLRLRLRLGLPMTEEIRVIPRDDPSLRRDLAAYRMALRAETGIQAMQANRLLRPPGIL